jgi:hypothetical protein
MAVPPPGRSLAIAGRDTLRGFAKLASETLGSFPWPRLLAFLAVVAAGTTAARLLGLDEISDTRPYLLGAAALLAIGLFSSTTGISIPEARANVKVIVIAVTLGVLAKTALIAAVMYVLFHQTKYVLLGMAVAQIDPLSVAAIRARSGMSPRAETILYGWASFDDPMTALITVYALSWFIVGADVGRDGVLPQLALNAAFVTVAYVVWRVTGGRGRRPPADARAARSAHRRRLAAQVAALVSMMVVAVSQFLMLAVATTGLFFRPRLGAWLRWVTTVAYWTAAFALGLVVSEGLDLAAGAALGFAAFGSQIIVSWVITRRLPRDDRVDLALAHQNGITAIILALLLEPSMPGSVAVVAPAIVVVNILHGMSNSVWNLRRTARRALDSPRTGEPSQNLPLNPLA